MCFTCALTSAHCPSYISLYNHWDLSMYTTMWAEIKYDSDTNISTFFAMNTTDLISTHFWLPTLWWCIVTWMVFCSLPNLVEGIELVGEAVNLKLQLLLPVCKLHKLGSIWMVCHLEIYISLVPYLRQLMATLLNCFGLERCLLTSIYIQRVRWLDKVDIMDMAYSCQVPIWHWWQGYSPSLVGHSKYAGELVWVADMLTGVGGGLPLAGAPFQATEEKHTLLYQCRQAGSVVMCDLASGCWSQVILILETPRIWVWDLWWMVGGQSEKLVGIGGGLANADHRGLVAMGVGGLVGNRVMSDGTGDSLTSISWLWNANQCVVIQRHPLLLTSDGSSCHGIRGIHLSMMALLSRACDSTPNGHLIWLVYWWYITVPTDSRGHPWSHIHEVAPYWFQHQWYALWSLVVLLVICMVFHWGPFIALSVAIDIYVPAQRTICDSSVDSDQLFHCN